MSQQGSKQVLSSTHHTGLPTLLSPHQVCPPAVLQHLLTLEKETTAPKSYWADENGINTADWAVLVCLKYGS